MAAAGRPREYDRVKILAAFEKYIKDTDIPIVAEFSSQQGFGRGMMYEWDTFKEALARCTAKKEAALERAGLDGSANVAMAIFSLKQLGWKDRTDLTHMGDAAAPIVVSSVDARL